MNPGTLRRALHLLHAITALALVASGALIAFADLRASLVGGYGRVIVAYDGGHNARSPRRGIHARHA